MPFHHGLTLTESATGPRALAALSSAVIGIIATATTTGDASAQDALDSLCSDMERVMERLERAGIQGDLGPVMNEEKDAEEWLSMEGSPKPAIENEREEPKTISYDELVASWQ